MAASGGQNQVASHVEENIPEKQGFFARVKDTLNLTKHLGFVSDIDSPANQAALAAVREREEREGVTEEVPQAPLSERVMQGITTVADIATVAATNASGGVAPRGGESLEQAETEKAVLSGGILGHPESDVRGTGDERQEQPSNVLGDIPGHPESDGQGTGDERKEQPSNVLGDIPGHPESDVRGTGDERKEQPSSVLGYILGHPESDGQGTGDERQKQPSNAPTPENSEQQHKHSSAHRSGHTQQNSQAADKGHSFSKWVRRAANKLGDAVASKDLTDDPS